VLVSVGPTNNTGGVVCTRDAIGLDVAEDEADIYHITALRAHWLATRDLNENGEPDFDYEGRTQRDEADPGSYMGKGFDAIVGTEQNPIISLLPDGTNGSGPLIHIVD
jgi:hypothetical protein